MIKIKNNLPIHPFFAEKEDLETCLDLLDKRPLKLIAPDLYDNESKWEKDAWSFSVENSKVIDKKVLLNQRDSFQFSIANSKSKQDFHVHKSTLEIYVSDFDIELFLNKGETPDIKAKGVLIIPPNVRHRVKLEGLTYVFQINQKKAKISQDKIIVSDVEYINEDENKNEFTWPDVEKGVDEIISNMEKDGYDPDLVIGIGRSGGIVGGLIAGYLQAKPFRGFNWNYKNVKQDGEEKRIHIHDKTIEIEKEQQKILLVEGATTTGQTPEKALAFFKETFPDKEFRFAVLVRQKSSTAPIHYCAYEVLGIKILPWHVDSWPTFLTHNIK
jgi:hypoxanthine phosphoribosyltransferase/quercetin dioxygenase-like cupin family protein